MKVLQNRTKDRTEEENRRMSGQCGRRVVSLLLCFCMLVSLLSDFGGGMLSSAVDSTGATGNVMSRIADRNTMDAYIGKLLSTDSGSRYAGRVWTDKSVFAFGKQSTDWDGKTLTLDMATDGYDGTLEFGSDFGTVFSALTSSQVVNEWPPAPIDLVIAIDMSASMAQDTRYEINDSAYKDLPVIERTMTARMQNSRIQKTIDAVNKTIDALMEQNKENRVSVVVYGAGAAVLMPLAHYAKNDGKPYLAVGGMETLYNLSDLQIVDGQWVWTTNRDACFTITVSAQRSDSDDPFSESDSSSEPYTNSVSNNVDNRSPRNEEKDKVKYTETVRAYPGYTSWDGLLEGSLELNPEMKELEAEVYVGYNTNTQGGIYLAYAQLAQTEKTTFRGELSTGESITVARIPAAIIMSDGGANFAFNEMTDWAGFYGVYSLDVYGGFRTDDSARDHRNLSIGWTMDTTDFSHRLGKSNTDVHNTGDEWYKVYLPGVFDDNKITSLYNQGTLKSDVAIQFGIYDPDLTLTTPAYWNNAGIFYSNDGDVLATAGLSFQVLLTAAYMRYVTATHYTQGWNEQHATTESRSELLTFTMSVDSKNVPQWGKLRLYPTLDPKGHSLNGDEKWWENDAEFGSDDELKNDPHNTNTEQNTQGLRTKEMLFSNLKELYNKWKNGDVVDAEIDLNDVTAVIKPIPPEGYTDERFHVTVTNDNVVENIAYNDGFYDIESGDISNRFAQILSEIVGSVFIPISGDNDAGVGDSVTYQDPLGEYMELKNLSINTATHLNSTAKDYDMALLLFGEMHGLVRAGVYDYQWNDKWMKKQNPAYAGETSFDEGWYWGEDPEDSNTRKARADELENDGSGSYPTKNPDGTKDNTCSEDAWKAGWVYRFSYTTMLSFVPINADIDPEDPPRELPDQIKNTVYTCYRFAGTQKDRNALHRNPVYGETVPEELQKIWEEYVAKGTYPVGTDVYSGYPGVYRLSDIRVWVEHTGDFVDEKGAITPEAQSGYDDSLYVNIPTAAIPTQLAEITLGPSGPISYKTNLGEDHEAAKVEEKKKGEAGYDEYLQYLEYCNYCSQSTPFRLFYAVGLSEDLIQRDAGGKQTGIDVSRISGEYIASHSDPETNNIYFVSNWYSNTTYTGYIGDEEGTNRTRGDAAVSFSPDAANRYYLFQKPLPLFAHAYRVQDKDGNITPVDNVENTPWDANRAGNGKTKWENGESPVAWSGGEFVGTYKDADSFKAALQKAQAAALIGGAHYIEDEKEDYYPLPDDITKAVITLQEDQLDKVQSTEDGSYTGDSVSFSSDDYFFLCIEYYVPTEGPGKDINGNTIAGTQAVRKISHMIARKGSAFGSGLHSENIGNGDMLCWSDINGNCTIEIEYNSRTDTGDNTRGEPTFEKLTCPDEELKEVLEKCWQDDAKYQSSLESDIEYWKSVRNDPYMKELIEQIKAAKAADYQEKDPSVVTDEDAQRKKYAELFDWSVSARTGGIRVGDMFNNVQPKLTEEESKDGNPTLDSSSGYYAGNVTHTSNNYYVPTLSETSTAGAGMVINNYLGNNGKLEIANSSLMVTKTLVAPDGFTLTKEQENTAFDYQVFIQGVTGLRSAQRLKFNPLSGTWQKRIESLDILTDNSSLLLASSGGRALFYFDKDAAEKTAPRQVIEVLEGTETKYFYADENGNAKTNDPYDGNTASLYYLYLPSNTEGELLYRLFGSTYDKGTEKIEGAGTTAYCDDPGKYGDLADNENQKFAQANGKLTAGSREYWTTAAVLIPYQEVQDAEHPANGALDESGGLGGGTAGPSMDAVNGEGQWSYSASNEANYQKLNGKDFSRGFTLVTVIPDPDGTDSTVWSPYSSRTQYMTESLYFGYKRDSVEELIANGEPLDNIDKDVLKSCELKGTDLYDPVVPDADRPDLFTGIGNDAIAKNTAEFTLKSGEGLLFTGLGNRIVYRFTEKISEEQMKKGFTLKEISHIQQRGSESIYRPGVQQIPIYSKDDATYGTEYGSASEKKTENGLTWPQSDLTPQNEPFAHTNAIMWEYYATMAAGASGNHHQPEGVTAAEKEESMQIWDGKNPNTYDPFSESHTVKTNPSCTVFDPEHPEKGGCDVEIKDNNGNVTGYLHYMYRGGELVDPHYEGEASTYLRNMSRYGVSPTVRFGVVGEVEGTEQEATVPAKLPADGYYDYSGVYSTFGNTGYFTEQVHYTNTVSPEMLVLVKTVVDGKGTIMTPQPDLDFTFTVKLETTAESEEIMKNSDAEHKLHYWQGSVNDFGKTPEEGGAPNLDEYQKYLDPALGILKTIEPDKGKTDEYTVPVKAGEAIVFYDLVTGMKYTVTEKPNEKYPAVDPSPYVSTDQYDNDTNYYDRTGTIVHSLTDETAMKPGSTRNRAHFFNQMETGVLTVEKKIDAESANPDAEFTFNVTLRPKEGETLQEKDLTVKKVKTAADGTETDDGTFEGLSWNPVDGGGLTATFKLKHGERITIEGIPLDTAYTVEEPAGGRKGYTLAHVAASAEDRAPYLDGATTPAFDRTTSSVSGTVTLKDIQAYLLFVNQPTTLTVEKKVLDESAAPDLSFTFNVTLTPAKEAELNEADLTVTKKEKAPDGTETDGTFGTDEGKWEKDEATGTLTATFKLKHGEKVVITGIPVGTTYTVQEPVEERKESGYTLEHVADNPDDAGPYLDGKTTPAFDRAKSSVTGTLTETEKAAQAYLLFANNKAVALPVSGGIGVGVYWLAGAALLLLFCVLGVCYRRKYGR